MCQIVELRKGTEMINYIERFLVKGNNNRLAWETQPKATLCINTHHIILYTIFKKINEDVQKKDNTYPKSVRIRRRNIFH